MKKTVNKIEIKGKKGIWGETKGMGGPPVEENLSQTYTEDSFPERVACLHPDCKGGGLSLGPIIREMIEEGETKRKISEPCCGHEPIGKTTRSCCGFFNFEITIQ